MNLMKRFFKTMISIVLACVFCTSLSDAMAIENNIYPQYGLGCISMTEEEKEMLIHKQQGDARTTVDYSNVVVLDSIDLSTSPYFPPIGNQGAINSCTSWATTYYQFTYEANKLNQITTTMNNAYSPTWTYNLTNNGIDQGSQFDDAYETLKRTGALRLEDCPYNPNNYSFDWSTDTDAMLEALGTRVVYYNPAMIRPSEDNKITYWGDSQLDEVKRLLCAGKILVVEVSANEGLENWSTKETANGEEAAYRAFYTGGGSHMLTVVGYNDSIQCDINGNGSIENFEKGAFKVVNSWGTDATNPYGNAWGNSGWIWVMYDAINNVSASSTTGWENSEPGTRVCIFTNGGTSNDFWYIEVANHTVNLAGLLTFTTNHRYDGSILTSRNNTATYSSSNQYLASGWSSDESASSFSGTVVVDYDTLDDDITNYMSNHKWFVRVHNYSDSGNITNVSYKIVDSEGKLIKDLGRIATTVTYSSPVTAYSSLTFRYGDIDYNNFINSADTTSIMAYIVRNIELSNLQKILADYNHDGSVDVLDITAINNSMSAAESAKFSAYIAEEYNRIASSPAKASADMTAEQAQAYAELVITLYEQIVLK